MDNAILASIVVDVQHKGKCVQVVKKGLTGPYEIHVDDKLIQHDLNAEDVIRWMGNAMVEDI